MHPGLLAGSGIPVVDAFCDSLVKKRRERDEALLRLLLLFSFDELDEIFHQSFRLALDHLVPKASFLALSVALLS